jgi:glycosyltransferase involved in cell wall biosynthesis
MHPMPTLSLLMANYNHARFLPDAFASIRSQTRQPDEVIVLDDGSTDDSAAVIASAVQDMPAPVFLRNERNRGFHYAFKRLLQTARGDYVFSMAADDVIHPDFLEKSMALLAQYPEAGLCSTRSRLMDASGRCQDDAIRPAVSDTPVYMPPARVRQHLIRYGNWISGNTVIFRRDAIQAMGAVQEDLGSYMDIFISQVLALTWGACYIPEPLAAFRRMEGGYSYSMVADPLSSLRMMQTVKHLMTTAYRDLFPGEYVAEWEKQWRCNAAWVFVEVSHRKHLQAIRALLSSGAKRSTVFLAFYGTVKKVEHGLLMLYFFLRYRPRYYYRRLPHLLKAYLRLKL